MEEGEDRCGEMGTVPQKMASGDGIIRAQGGHKGTKQGRVWWLGAWGTEFRYGIVKRRWVFPPVWGVLSERSIIIHVMKGIISCARPKSSVKGVRYPSQVHNLRGIENSVIKINNILMDIFKNPC